MSDWCRPHKTDKGRQVRSAEGNRRIQTAKGGWISEIRDRGEADNYHFFWSRLTCYMTTAFKRIQKSWGRCKRRGQAKARGNQGHRQEQWREGCRRSYPCFGWCDKPEGPGEDCRVYMTLIRRWPFDVGKQAERYIWAVLYISFPFYR